MNVTRSISTYKALATTVEVVDGKPQLAVLAEGEFFGTKPSVTEARRALTAQGAVLPRGCTVTVEALETHLYGCPVEQFLAVAQPIG